MTTINPIKTPVILKDEWSDRIEKQMTCICCCGKCACGKCVCQECDATEDDFYDCELCKRTLPISFGASDNFADLCDDCWAYKTELLELTEDKTHDN